MSFVSLLLPFLSPSVGTIIRETLLPHWWEGEDIALYGGKDVKAGGSWLAVSKCGRVAFLTNFREKVSRAKRNLSSALIVGSLTLAFFVSLCADSGKRRGEKEPRPACQELSDRRKLSERLLRGTFFIGTRLFSSCIFPFPSLTHWLGLA